MGSGDTAGSQMATRRVGLIALASSLFLCVCALPPWVSVQEEANLAKGVRTDLRIAMAKGKPKAKKPAPGAKPDPKLVAKDEKEIKEMDAAFSKEFKRDGGIPKSHFKIMKKEPPAVTKVFKASTNEAHRRFDKADEKLHKFQATKREMQKAGSLAQQEKASQAAAKKVMDRMSNEEQKYDAQHEAFQKNYQKTGGNPAGAASAKASAKHSTIQVRKEYQEFTDGQRPK